MNRIVLILLLLIFSKVSYAQVATTSDKKTVGDTIDYSRIGAPMPYLYMTVFSDTARQENRKTIKQKHTITDTTTRTEQHLKKEKKAKNKRGHRRKQKPYLTIEDFDKYDNLLVMMFNPNCSHCEDETALLEKNISLFKNTKIIMLANPLMWEYLPNFTNSFHTFDYPIITVGCDSAFLNKLFLYNALPQINIYDKNRKLKRTFYGETGIDKLTKYIE